MRYDLLRAAQSALYRKGLAHGEQHRTCWCCRIVGGSEHVEVFRRIGIDGRADGARFGNVGVCGSVWTCPICAQRIAEVRRRELIVAREHARGLGLSSYLLTWTFPHAAGDDLADLERRFGQALQRARNSRAFKRVCEGYGRLGAVHATEATWGINGWHPHRHDVWFARPGLEDDRATIRALKGIWLRACLKAGLLKTDGTLATIRAFWRHGFDLTGGAYVEEYVAKFGRDPAWSMPEEVTRSHAKLGIRRAAWSDAMHFSPFQLLTWAAGGDRTARDLFAEYARVYTGKRMLTWTRGLKAQLGIAELDDQDAAAAPLPEERKIGRIDAADWSLVFQARALGELAELIATSASSQADIDAFLSRLRARPPSGRGVVLVRNAQPPFGFLTVEGDAWAQT